jgi:hypothetical protein
MIGLRIKRIIHLSTFAGANDKKNVYTDGSVIDVAITVIKQDALGAIDGRKGA